MDNRHEKDTLNSEIGHRIFLARNEKGMSRDDLASRSGISAQFLRMVENGDKGLSSNSIRNISRALNVTSDFLLFGNEDNENRLKYATQALASFSNDELAVFQGILDKYTAVLRPPD